MQCYACLMDKIYISADDLLIDSFKLAKKIFDSGFRPQFIVGVWRGGAPVGIAVQEYLDFVGIKTDHIAIRTSSYYGIGLQDKEVRVHGLNYIVDNVNATDELLLVDDVFDSGRSVIAVIKELKEKTRANLPKTIKIATPWYKPNRNATSIVPDFFIQYVDKNGKSISELIEIKPKRQTRIQAAEKGMSTKAAVAMNNAKWEAAGAWCRQKGIKFRVLTEDDIFHNPKRR
mgnify:CR=1 FL=1